MVDVDGQPHPMLRCSRRGAAIATAKLLAFGHHRNANTPVDAGGTAPASTTAPFTRPSSRRTKPEQDDLVAEIRAIHADSDGSHGSPRVYAEQARRGGRANPKRAERLMREAG
jgi:HTH-like domain